MIILLGIWSLFVAIGRSISKKKKKIFGSGGGGGLCSSIRCTLRYKHVHTVQYRGTCVDVLYIYLTERGIQLEQACN